MEKNKVQNDKVQTDDEISNEDLDKVAGGATAPTATYMLKEQIASKIIGFGPMTGGAGGK